MAKKYDESSIQRHSGLLGIRKRPTMYMGQTDSTGIWTLIRELMDNVCDLTTKKIVKKITGHLICDPDKTAFWIMDDGPGIPVGMQTFLDEKGKKEKLSTLYVVTGLTHGGSNFDTDTHSRGVNGVGSKCSNAMSKNYKVWTWRDGKCYSIFYKDAKLIKEVSVDKPPKLPFGNKFIKGTLAYFEPDLSLFEKGSKFDIQMAKDWCTITSVLVENLTFKITNAKGKTSTYLPIKIADYLATRLEECKTPAMGKMFLHHGKNIDVALYFASAENNEFIAYTNGLLNVGGGVHVKIVQDAIAKSLKPYALKKDEYKPADLYDGIVGLVNAKLAAPRFNVQTKDVLLDDRLKPAVGEEVYEAFVEFWNKNKTLAKDVIKRAVSLRKATHDFLHDKQLIKKVDSAKKKLSSKFADVTGKVPASNRELILVEGDSAGGGAKRARNKQTQAVLPLRGKPLNVMEASKDKVWANEEFTTLLAAIGINLKAEKPFENLRFGKIVFLTDPDVDGKHITTLLLTMLYKYASPLIKSGKVFTVNTPEYMGKYRGKTYFGFTVDEVYKKAGTKNMDITHLKGLGECDEKDLKVIALDPETRALVQFKYPEDKKDLKSFEALMGKDPSYRKQLLGIR